VTHPSGLDISSLDPWPLRGAQKVFFATDRPSGSQRAFVPAV